MRTPGSAVGATIALLVAFASLVVMGSGLGELIRLTLSGSDLRLERHLAAGPCILRTPLQVLTYAGSGMILLPVVGIAAAI